MIDLDPNILRAIPCEELAKHYAKLLEEKKQLSQRVPNQFPPNSDGFKNFETDRQLMLSRISSELTDPLNAVRRRVANLVEELFRKKGERTFIMGCMHYPKDAPVDFLQTQTLVTDILPQKICRTGEDHLHRSAVTIDLRASPEERVELRINDTLNLIATSTVSQKISPYGPDFTRRDIQKISHLDDFLFVKNINKIYLERVPFVEKGPLVDERTNIPLFKKIHKLLGPPGILAFDYSPNFQLYTSKGEGVNLFADIKPTKTIVVSEAETKNFMNDPLYKKIFEKMLKGDIKPTSITCDAHGKSCPATPCTSLITTAARYALENQIIQAENNAIYAKKREEIQNKPKAVLDIDELNINIGKKYFPLANFEKVNLTDLQEFPYNSVVLICKENRTQDEINSLSLQFDYFAALNLLPALEGHIDPKNKKLLDHALTLLTEKVVFPQLKILGFEKVSFDPNGRNPENKRPFERVIYAKKI